MVAIKEFEVCENGYVNSRGETIIEGKTNKYAAIYDDGILTEEEADRKINAICQLASFQGTKPTDFKGKDIVILNNQVWETLHQMILDNFILEAKKK